MLRLVLFAKSPRPGRVKTRLRPALGDAPTVELYRAFVCDQLRLLDSFRPDCEVELCTDGPWPRDVEFDRLVRGATVTGQGPGDLGSRLLRCFERTAREGARATVIVAADAPTLPRSRVQRAFRELDTGAPAVLVPSDDGGYVLLGLRRPLPGLFREVPWGGADVLGVTLRRARESGVALEQLAPWYDVDDETGLRRLRAELLRPAAAARAPATARRLRTP